MAYNLPLQLLIQPPTQANLSSIRRQIESSLKGLNVDIVDPKNFAKTNAAIQKTSKQLDRGRQSANQFWDTLEGKARGAVAYTIVNTALLKLTSTVSQATREALKYETELLKISQVTGDSVKATREYSATLVDVSKKYNVALSKVAQLTRTLTQTGLSFKEAAKGADILAKTSLLATFDSLTSTTEGLIAVMQTFNLTVQQAGDVLEKINAVSKQFAVESSDIVEAIRRTGGAFGSAGGQVEELIALFTSVRSTSRESAETIATGFRTIFGRLQRPKTIEYFKQLGIQLETAEGQFIGPLNAIREISEGLERLNIAAGSTRFAEVVEQIGGIRQISRVVPLLEEFEKTQRAIDIQNNAGAQSTEDLAKAQQGLAFQLGQLNKEFGAFISDVVNSPSFKFLADVFINTSRAVLGLVSSLKPLLPILATVAAFKIGRGISTLLSGGLKGATKSLGFASGGMVPGSGNGDTVPAMLTPGEFVIRKSAVQAFGADRLAGINRYAKGGPVTLNQLSTRGGGSTILDSFDDLRQPQDGISANLDRRAVTFGDDSIDWRGLVKRTDEIYQPLKSSGQGSRAKNKKNAFYAAAKAFEESIQKITGGKLSEDQSAPVDIVRGNQNIEVKFTQAMTDEKDLISKLYRQKYLNNQLPKRFTSGEDKDVGIGKLTVFEMGEGQKAEFQKWYNQEIQAGILKKAAGGAVGGEAEKPQKEFGKILLSEDATGIEAKYAANENRVGFVRTKLWKDNLYTVGLSKASRGYGPKLYDVAMEAITARGGMLTSDRATVSGDARKVWDFYFRNRSDVKKKPLPRDQWTGNYALVDEKLRGPQETWPPATDPAWALQTGYSKSPSLINDPNTVQRVKGQQSSAAMALNYFSRFANGGSVNTGTDTVPALLTPGEFVINKKSAQSFGYNNLKNINRYADGGFVTMDGSMGDAARATAMAKNPFASMSGSMGAAAQKTTAAMNGFADKLKEASKITEEAAKNTEETSKKTKVSFLEFAFGMQSAISSLKVFAGIPINQEVFTAANTQAQQYNLVAESLRRFDQDALRNLRRNTANASKSIKSFGSGLAARGGVRGGVGRAIQGGGNILGKVAVGLAKYGPMIVKGLTTIARVFDITAWASLIGGFVDALFSENIKGQKEAAIQAGDVAKAGALAAEQYNQEMLRGIPIIGGFLAPFSESIDSTILFGTVVRDAAVATAELQATMVKFDRDFATSQRDFDRALMTGDPAEIQGAMQAQRELLQDARGRADAQASNVLKIRQKERLEVAHILDMLVDLEAWR
jgi:TP901 family phage tail tape measure protein